MSSVSSSGLPGTKKVMDTPKESPAKDHEDDERTGTLL